MAKNSAKIGVLLVNLGTPDSTKTGDVRKYLREFLMDGRVIDFPFIPRWMLVNLIIAPFRAPKSAGEYRKLWTDRGSPLLFHTQDLKEKLIKKNSILRNTLSPWRCAIRIQVSKRDWKN